MFFFIIASTIIIALIEGPSLARKKQWKDMTVFAGFLLVGFALGTILAFRLPFPNPAKGIEMLFKPVSEAFFGKS